MFSCATSREAVLANAPYGFDDASVQFSTCNHSPVAVAILLINKDAASVKDNTRYTGVIY